MRSVRRPLGRHPPRPRCARAVASVCFSHGPASTRIGSLYPAPFNNAWCAWPKPSSFRKADRSIHRAAVASSRSASFPLLQHLFSKRAQTLRLHTQSFCHAVLAPSVRPLPESPATRAVPSTPETAPPRPDDLTLQRLHIDIRHPGWVERLLKRLKLDLVYRAEL